MSDDASLRRQKDHKGKVHRFYYGWIIVIIIFISFGMASGSWASFALLYNELLVEFGRSRASTAGIFSFTTITFSVSAWSTGFMLDRFGARRVMFLGGVMLALGLFLTSQTHSLWAVYLTLGIIMALGIPPLSSMATTTVLPNWFVRLRATSQGLSTAGGGTGVLLLTLLMQAIIVRYGWRTAALTVSAIVAFGLLPLIAIFLRSYPSEMGLFPDGNPLPIGDSQDERSIDSSREEWTWQKAIRTWRFHALLSILVFRGFSTSFAMAHVIALLTDIGVSQSVAAVAFSMAALFSALGNPIGGYIADRIGREWGHTLSAITSILGMAALLLLQWTTNPVGIYAYVLLYGYGRGSEAPILMSAQSDVFHSPRSGNIYGLLFAGVGVGGALSAWLGGYIYDVTGTYTLMIALVILAMAGGNLGLWLVAPRRMRPMRF